MRTQKLIVFIAIFFTVFVKAQISISGKIKDNVAVIPFANVILKETNGKLITGTTSNDKGVFNLQTASGKYIIQISFIGYKKWEKEISVTKNVDLGTIEIFEEENTLQEVIITADKKVIEQKTDRLVFNVSNSIAATGGDAVDALKVAPGITIQNNSISMLGGGIANVMIEGRMLQLSGEELLNFLNAIAADDIKSIEIINNPPAQYEAIGNGGIINIIYKKGRKNSWKNTSTLSYNANKYGFGTLRNNFSYNKNKLSINASVNTSRGSSPNIETSLSTFPNSVWKVRLDEKNTRKNTTGRVLVNYKLSDTFELGGQLMHTSNTPISKGVNTTTFLTNTNKVDSLLVNNDDRKTTINTTVFNTHFITKLDTLGRKLSVDFDYFNYENKLNAVSLVNTFSTDNIFTGINQSVQNLTQQQIENYSVKLDMQHPFKSISFSYGAKFSVLKTANSIKNYNLISGDAVLDTNLSNQFNYEEKIQAAYVNASKKINKKWNLQAGLRVENTTTKGFSETLNKINKNSYVKLFPSLFVSYKKDDYTTITFNYGSGISRPVFRDLNPFRSYLNTNVYSEGNPFMQPAFVDRFNLSYNYKGKLITSFYFRNTQNGFGTLFSADPDENIQAVIRRNYYNANYWELSQMYNVKPTSWWKSQNYAHISVTQARVFNNFDAQVKDGVQFKFSTNNSFSVARNTSVEAAFFYQSKTSSNIYTLGSMYGLNLGVKKSFLNNKIQTSILFNDVFNTASLNNLVSTINGVTNNYGQNYNSRHIRFSISYNFGNKKIAVKNRAFGNSDTQQRAN